MDPASRATAPDPMHNETQDDLYIGVMSGTSLDGIDAVLAQFPVAGRPPVRLIAHVHHAFADDLRAALFALQRPGENELHRAAVAAQHLARGTAQAIAELLDRAGCTPAQVRAAGVHGQTVRHRPDAGYTIQINAPAVVAELTEIDVIADFRARDIAAGGEGAPLVPAFHDAVFRADHPRAIVNIGGIANITALPARKSVAEAVLGFDCGPGNVLIDLWHARHRGGPYDRGGAWAAQGRSDPALLATLRNEPFLSAPPPKSTGRDLFHADWLDRNLARADPDRHLAVVDVQSTLTRFTAVTIADAIRRHHPSAQDIVVCGGGAYNATLMRMLQEECPAIPVLDSGRLDIAPEHVEGLAFAWLAQAYLAGTPGNLPEVTGARHPRVLGARYPR